MTKAPAVQEVSTPVGTARTTTEGPSGGATMVLGHGAGGGIDAPDLLAARDAALGCGLRVVRVEQPWRLAGRRIAEAPPRLDLAWTAVLEALDGPLVAGGRSAGARVACRTAAQTGAAAVLALAFPLVPPGRPDRSRLAELLLPSRPRLVVQGSRDGFGIPPAVDGVEVHVVEGADHAFSVRRRDGRKPQEVLDEIRDGVASWLRRQTLT